MGSSYILVDSQPIHAVDFGLAGPRMHAHHLIRDLQQVPDDAVLTGMRWMDAKKGWMRLEFQVPQDTPNERRMREANKARRKKTMGESQ